MVTIFNRQILFDDCPTENSSSGVQCVLDQSITVKEERIEVEGINSSKKKKFMKFTLVNLSINKYVSFLKTSLKRKSYLMRARNVLSHQSQQLNALLRLNWISHTARFSWISLLKQRCLLFQNLEN